ncbi:DUF1998 domain-containing protein [Bacillus pumilus]|nr:DUF1998 domain-containing protein [Bacillus pumilus]MBU8656170.1 DUF1998 domain-containing protein [Bacillus pumilus]
MKGGIAVKNEVGEVRPGQLITTYGPGAIMDSVNDSLVILDIKYWINNDNNEKIYDKNLMNFLKKDFFRKIPSKHYKDLPAIPFPNYHVCSNFKCSRLFDIRDNFIMSEYLKGGPKCPDCSRKSYPARFVVSCQENHLDDFPWRWWAHGKQETDCKGKLRLWSTGNTSSLDSLFVECECKRSQSLRGAMQVSSFEGYRCTGNHPHKLNKRSICKKAEYVIPLQRGASNVYFPALRSAIAIPSNDNKGINLDEIFVSIKDNANTYAKLLGDKWYHRFYREYLNDRSEFLDADDFFEKWTAYLNQSKIEEQIEYNQIKEAEYRAFTTFDNRVKIGDFEAEVEIVPNDFQLYFNKIIKAHKVKEILVLLGFMRNDSPEPDVNEPKEIVWLESDGYDDWLPAVEVHGEGIFIEFNQTTISKWLKENSELPKRSEKFTSLYANWIENKGWEVRDKKDVVYVMLHTFAHLLIKQLSLQSGYSSVAIKERIYCGKNMAGILLYTGSTDQEGSLGGLVEMGNIDKLRPLIVEALEDAIFCSNDPYCSSLEPSEDNQLNGCACFACSMVAETSCETGNRLLDRSLLVKTIDSKYSPFFKGLL